MEWSRLILHFDYTIVKTYKKQRNNRFSVILVHLSPNKA